MNNLDLSNVYKRSFSAFCQDILHQLVADFYKKIIAHVEAQQLKPRNKTNLAILVSRGHGKAQSLDSKVLTPTGFVKIRDLKLGDAIYNSSGKVCQVHYLHPLEYSDLYELTTRDGRKAICTKEHTWKVMYDKKVYLKELQQIKEIYSHKRHDKRNGKNYIEYPYFLNTITPISFPEKELPIDAYTLGVWLGDGRSNSGQITSNDPEIFKYIPYESYKCKSKFMYNIVGLNKLLRLNNLKNNKHIPDLYLHSSYTQRLDLLKGLMDTDGYIQKTGDIFEYTTKLNKLSDNVIYLIRSLGGTTTHSVKKIKINNNYKFYNRISFRLPKSITPFKLSRKSSLCNGSIKTKSAITDIKYIGKGWARCIATTSRDGSYITDDFMPTQNTITFSKAFPLWMIYKSEKPICIIIKSMNQDMARRILGLSRDEINANPAFKHFKFKKETDKLLEIYVPGYEGNDLMTHKIYSVPMDTRGLHGDIVISDDVQKDEDGNSVSSLKKLKSTWWNTTSPMSNSLDGIQLVIGTPVAHNDLFQDIKEIRQKGGNWEVFEFPAMYEDSNGVLQPQFPELFSMDKLLKIRDNTPDWTWQQEYMLVPVGQDAMFSLELINSCTTLEYQELTIDELKFRETYMGCDVAMSSSSTADFSGFCVVSKAPGRPIKLEHIWHERGISEDAQINEIKNLKRIFNVTHGLIEQKGLTYSMAGKVVTDTELAGVMDTWNPTNEEKQKILGNLYLLMKHKMLYIPLDLNHSDLLVKELMSFGIINENGTQRYRAMSGHDDLVIGVALAVAAAGGWVFEEPVEYKIQLI